MTDHTIHANGSSSVKRAHKHEGPKNHLLAFALSIVLTALAFLAVAYGVAEEDVHIERWFVLMFIVLLAFIQAVLQLVYWMHMKDKGHAFPRLFISMGFLIGMTVVAGGLLWSWW